MKVIVALACIIACAQASYPSAILSTGTSSSSRTQDAAGNYAFAYNEQHSTGGSSRRESGNGWGSEGSYTLNVADGRQRKVKYVADGNGFRASISTNEPGTAALPAADTSIASPYAPPQPVQPLPVPVAVAEPAPLVAAPIVNGWGAQPIAVAAPLPEPVAALPALPALAAPISGWGAQPIAAPIVQGWGQQVLAPVAVAVAPAVSSYSTSINHVAPAKALAVALPEPIVQARLSGWN